MALKRVPGLTGYQSLNLLLKEESTPEARFQNMNSPIVNRMEEMRNQHNNPNSKNISSLIDIEALALFKDHSLREIEAFYIIEKRKDDEEAETEFDKLTEHQHAIIKRALEFHYAYREFEAYQKRLKRVNYPLGPSDVLRYQSTIKNECSDGKGSEGN